MKNSIKILIATVLFISLSAPASAAIPSDLSAIISEAQTHHKTDYLKLQNLEDLAPSNYLKARVQKPTAARAMKRMDIHEGVLLEALLQPSLHLVPAQTFPAEMSDAQKLSWQKRVLDALQVGAAAALAHRHTPHAEAALAFALGSDDFVGIRAPLCVFYGRLARHAQGVAQLKAIAETATGRIQESAIIGLGKTRQLGAFHALQAMLQQSANIQLHKTVIHALGHLANRAAQKANPLENDKLIQIQVRDALVKRIDRPSALPHEKVALASLTLVLNPEEMLPVQKQLAQARARQLVSPVFSRIQKRALSR